VPDRIEGVLRSDRVLRCAAEIESRMLHRSLGVLEGEPATQPVDSRKGVESLILIVRDVFGNDRLTGHLFIFFSMRRDRVRIVKESSLRRRSRRPSSR
jgi:hypothetical protein